jgi:hypothetical protein
VGAQGQQERRSKKTKVREGGARRAEAEVDDAGGRRQSSAREEPSASFVCLARA